MTVFWFRMASAEMWARSVAPSVYSDTWPTGLGHQAQGLPAQSAQAGDQQADDQLRGARAK